MVIRVPDTVVLPAKAGYSKLHGFKVRAVFNDSDLDHKLLVSGQIPTNCSSIASSLVERIMVTFALLLACLLGSKTLWAVTWNLPTPYSDSTHHSKLVKEFAENVRLMTKGTLTIKVHSGGSLIKHHKIHRAVKTRQVELGELFIGRLGNLDPIFKLDNIPFLATDLDSAKKLYQISRPILEKRLAKDRLVLLYSAPWPPQDLYSTKAINRLADLKGLRLRVYSPTTARLADLLGSTPVNIPVTDVAQAFSTNAIEAMITSPTTGVNSQSWDYVKHYTRIKAWIPKNMVIVNRAAFRQLTKQQQAAVLEAARQAEEKAWQLVPGLVNQQIAILNSKGMTVKEPNSAFKQDFAAIGKTIIDEWLKEAGSSGQQLIDNYNKSR